MYTVIFYRDYGSPMELQIWLDKMYDDGLELVSADGGYFIFKKRDDILGKREIDRELKKPGISPFNPLLR